MIHFLHYVEESTDSYANETKDETIIKIHDKISRMKADRNLEVKYMTIAEYMEDEMAERRSEMREEGGEAMLTPVSYTHLDVYKRQARDRESESPERCPRTRI